MRWADAHLWGPYNLQLELGLRTLDSISAGTSTIEGLAMRNAIGRCASSAHPEAERAPHEGVSAFASGGADSNMLSLSPCCSSRTHACIVVARKINSVPTLKGDRMLCE